MVPTWDLDLNLRLRQLDNVLSLNTSDGLLRSQSPTKSNSVAVEPPTIAAPSTATAEEFSSAATSPPRTKVFSCVPCKQKFHSARSLAQHRIAHHSEKAIQAKAKAGDSLTIYNCQYCDMTFNSSASRNTHRRKIHQRDHLCVRCDVAFGSAQKLDRHLKTHTGIKEFKCETCGKEFMIERNLTLHYKLHLGQKDYKCDICERTYFTKSGLQAHQRQIHSSSTGEIFTCKDCHVTFPTKYDLLLHRKIHRGASERCPVCNQGFASQSELKLHKIACHSNRPFACTKCPHRSKTQDKLDRHMLCHTSKDTFRCEHCSKTFVFKNSLKKHLEKKRCLVLKMQLGHVDANGKPIKTSSIPTSLEPPLMATVSLVPTASLLDQNQIVPNLSPPRNQHSPPPQQPQQLSLSDTTRLMAMSVLNQITSLNSSSHPEQHHHHHHNNNNNSSSNNNNNNLMSSLNINIGLNGNCLVKKLVVPPPS